MAQQPDFPAHRIFTSLQGTWALERAMGEMGQFSGNARFFIAPDSAENTLRYREEGVLHRQDGQKFDGYREYDFVLQGNAIEMLFRDPVSFGNRYVLLNFSQNAPGDAANNPEDSFAAQDHHPCGNDLYHHRMFWYDDDHFETRIKVVGPNKDYELHTVYHKLERQG
ncbi:DUF6314 family protein [Thalassospira marina]|nr:DUF6314 family protein [Thalassospira marina]